MNTNENKEITYILIVLLNIPEKKADSKRNLLFTVSD